MSATLRRTLLPAARAAVARQTTTASGSLKTSLSQRVSARGYAADPNAPPKVPYPWNDPMNPSNWKEEHVRADDDDDDEDDDDAGE